MDLNGVINFTCRILVGFLFFDVLNTQSEPRLISPLIKALPSGDKKICITFWFSAFGRDETSTMKVFIEPEDQSETEVNFVH